MPRGRDDLGRALRLKAQQRADEANKTLNLALRGREKVFEGVTPPYELDEAERIPNSTPEGREARLSSMDAGNPCGPGYEWIEAPQSAGKTRHRATKCCYSIDKAMEVLVIIMRDGSMIMYDGVDAMLWDLLKQYDSTHDFIDMYLVNAPYTNLGSSGYSQLPRKRPEEFQLGIER